LISSPFIHTSIAFSIDIHIKFGMEEHEKLELGDDLLVPPSKNPGKGLK
jgi:hypothetical protein